MKPILALTLALGATSLVGCTDTPDSSDDPSEPMPGVIHPDLNGDTWTTVDDLPYTSGRGAVFDGVAVAPNGKVWVVGYRTESSFDETWLVRDSGNGGATFGFNSDFTYPGGGTAAVPTGIAIDAAGRIFIAGWALDANNDQHWIVRRSVDDGQSWQTVDDWRPSGSETFAASIAIDDSDEIFVGGGGTDQNGDAFWKVRRSTDHGATWNQADFVDEGPMNGVAASVNGVCFNAGDVIAAGSRPTAQNTTAWQVRTSANSWSTKENWVPSNGGAQANGCGGFGGTDALYVAGQQMPASVNAHWIVQRSANGDALATVDDISTGDDITAAFAVRPGNTGTIYAAGVIGLHWRVRKTTNGTTWVNSDDFSLADTGPSMIAEARALKYSDALGHTFVVGYATDSSNRQHGIVRRR